MKTRASTGITAADRYPGGWHTATGRKEWGKVIQQTQKEVVLKREVLQEKEWRNEDLGVEEGAGVSRG